jgi:DNA-binding transcriptional LysR family regulator
VEPTALAASLQGPVAELLDRLRQTLATHAPFDPATTDRVFTVALSEYAESVLVPPLLEMTAREAPHVLLAVRHADRTNALDLLEAGEAEMAVAVLPEPPALYTRLRLLPEEFVTVMRPGHKLAEGDLTLERFASVPHLLHSPNGSRDGALDGPMAEAGHPRRVGAVVAHLGAVPAILARTDMVMTLSARLACRLRESHRLVLRTPPVAIRHTRLSLVFHRRFEADPGHAWLRRAILAVARDVEPAPTPRLSPLSRFCGGGPGWGRAARTPEDQHLVPPTHPSFDHVIVGAGSAGCLLADRLSAAGRTVAVVEAGGRGPAPLPSHPAGYARILTHPPLPGATAPNPGRGDRRPRPGLPARARARRVLLDQRAGACLGRSLRLRPLGAEGLHGLVLGRPRAAFRRL